MILETWDKTRPAIVTAIRFKHENILNCKCYEGLIIECLKPVNLQQDAIAQNALCNRLKID